MGGMRSSQDPYSGGDQIVDQLIGQAFATVRTVADRLPMLEQLADAIPEGGTFVPNDLATLNVVIDGGRDVIQPGVKTDVTIPFACRVVGWTLLADVQGSVKLDIWKDTLAHFPPAVEDSIVDLFPPKLVNAQTGKNALHDLDTWLFSINPDDVLRISVISCSNIERLTLALKLERV